MWGKVVAIFGISQAAALSAETKQRRQAYVAASEVAKLSGKPLLVAGGPWGSSSVRLLPPRHGCGAVCVDLSPRACAGCNFIQADIRDIPLPDGYAGAAIASHIIEHLPTVADAEDALDELHRVADQVFIAYPNKLNLIAWLSPEHHLWVRQLHDGRMEIEQR